jgi:hypothetical protein
MAMFFRLALRSYCRESLCNGQPRNSADSRPRATVHASRPRADRSVSDNRIQPKLYLLKPTVKWASDAALCHIARSSNCIEARSENAVASGGLIRGNVRYNTHTDVIQGAPETSRYLNVKCDIASKF